jgi:predicted TIM-barrel fold metal-dependent hydrolase
VRVHQEHAALARRMAKEKRSRYREASAEIFQQRARGYDEDAQIVRGLLRDYTATVDPEQSAPGGKRCFPIAETLAARGVPFAFLTGYGDAGLPFEYRGAARLTKPFNLGTLHKLVEDLFKESV